MTSMIIIMKSLFRWNNMSPDILVVPENDISGTYGYTYISVFFLPIFPYAVRVGDWRILRKLTKGKPGRNRIVFLKDVLYISLFWCWAVMINRWVLGDVNIEATSIGGLNTISLPLITYAFMSKRQTSIDLLCLRKLKVIKLIMFILRNVSFYCD